MSATDSSAAGRPARLTVGVVGAGRVGAVLAAALDRIGHRVVAVSAVSGRSRARAALLVPAAHVVSPPEVLAAADLVLLTVPDDVLPGLVAGLVATGSIRPGQFLVHTSGRYRRRGARTRDPRGCASPGAAPGDDVHRHCRGPAAARRRGVRRHRTGGTSARRRGAGPRDRRRAGLGRRRSCGRCGTRLSRTVPTTSSPCGAVDGPAPRGAESPIQRGCSVRSCRRPSTTRCGRGRRTHRARRAW